MARIPVHLKRLPNQTESMKSMYNARDDTTKNVAEQRIAITLGQNVLNAANNEFEVNDEVVMFRE